MVTFLKMVPHNFENSDDIFGAIPEVKAAAIFSTEGIPIAFALPKGVDATRIAAITASLLSLSERIIVEFAKGDFDKLIVKGSSGYLLLLKAGKSAILMVSTTSEVRLGLIELDCRRICEKIDDINVNVIIDDILQGRCSPGNIFRFRRGNNSLTPYIGLPPSPPGDLGVSSQVQIHQEKETLYDNPFCKHCGSFLPEGQSTCQNCGKKVS